jgi:hypothetical protein
VSECCSSQIPDFDVQRGTIRAGLPDQNQHLAIVTDRGTRQPGTFGSSQRMEDLVGVWIDDPNLTDRSRIRQQASP